MYSPTPYPITPPMICFDFWLRKPHTSLVQSSTSDMYDVRHESVVEWTASFEPGTYR